MRTYCLFRSKILVSYLFLSFPNLAYVLSQVWVLPPNYNFSGKLRAFAQPLLSAIFGCQFVSLCPGGAGCGKLEPLARCYLLFAVYLLKFHCGGCGLPSTGTLLQLEAGLNISVTLRDLFVEMGMDGTVPPSFPHKCSDPLPELSLCADLECVIRAG